jgi:hypothetical protein
MFKRKSIIIIPILLSTVLLSCKDWLVSKPENGTDRRDYWKTKEQVKASVIGIYQSMTEADITEKYFYWGELRGGMVYPFNTSQRLIYNYEIDADNSVCNWAPFYRIINFCNVVIEFAPQVLETDLSFTQAQLDQYLAEAHGVRALMYFYLLRTFGEVPIKLDASYSDGQDFFLPKSSKEEVMQQILKDLDFSQKYAVTTYGDVANNKGRITKYSVLAMKADVYLWEDRFQDCADMCDSIIQSNKFGLVPGYQWFDDNFVKGNSNENIFELQFDQQNLNSFYRLFYPTSRSFMVNDWVYELFAPAGKLYTDVRSSGSSFRLDGTIWKYLGLNSGTSRSESESYAHWIFYRYADILLMKAEALTYLNRGSEASDIVARIRRRAYAEPTMNKQFTSSDEPSKIVLYILEERAREFTFEGKRWYDVLRVARHNNYALLKNVLIPLAITTAPAEELESIMKRIQDPNGHYFPIVQSEITRNPKLVQNPFYN